MDNETEKTIRDTLNGKLDTLFEKGRLPNIQRKKPQAIGTGVRSKFASNLVLCSVSILQLVLTLSPLTVWDIGLAASIILGVLGLSKIESQDQVPGEKQGVFVR
ncbi:MAG TPA: hypothetical protein PKI87_09715 [Arenimonas sp.]|nr:hypothetical protein [Arenimonas sp.]